MLQRTHASAIQRSLSSAMLTTVMAAALSACGGGGGSSPATVSSMSIASSKPGAPVYGQPVTVTVNGTNLGNLSLTAPGCKNVTRLTAAPTASTDTTAYFSCTPSGAYTSSISAVSNGTTLSQQTLTVPAPIVSMAVSGGGVSGNIIFNLKGDVAPATVDNFLAYVNAGFYDGADGKGSTIFHRLVNFNDPQSGHFPYAVVQGGGYLPTTNPDLPPSQTKPATHDPIQLETGGGKNVQWTASMARNNLGAQTQFFFNVIDNSSSFDTSSGPGYAVFADVSGSAAVITQIFQILQTPSACPALVGFSDGSCMPVPNVKITSATQIQ